MSSIEAANLFNVKGLVAVVTGGGSGIGLMISKALALNGAHKVYIVGRRKEVLDTAAEESPHGNIIPLKGDVTSSSSLASLVEHITKDVGYVNLVIANSGIGGADRPSMPPESSISALRTHLFSVSNEAFTNTFAVNTTAVFYTTVAFLELLDAGNKRGNVSQKSQVIATSSIGGFNRRPMAGFAYGASKAAVTHLMKSLASYLVPFDIRCNVLAPGLYPSDLAAPIIGDRDATKEGAFDKTQIPVGRAGSEVDMAGTILFMTSRAGAYCNGNVVISDGGRLSVMTATY